MGGGGRRLSLPNELLSDVARFSALDIDAFAEWLETGALGFYRALELAKCRRALAAAARRKIPIDNTMIFCALCDKHVESADHHLREEHPDLDAIIPFKAPKKKTGEVKPKVVTQTKRPLVSEEAIALGEEEAAKKVKMSPSPENYIEFSGVFDEVMRERREAGQRTFTVRHFRKAYMEVKMRESKGLEDAGTSSDDLLGDGDGFDADKTIAKYAAEHQIEDMKKAANALFEELVLKDDDE